MSDDTRPQRAGEPVENAHGHLGEPHGHLGEQGAPEAGFDCPRCGSAVREPFYGPCGTCRDTLRATVRAEAADVVAADYEPKMNVTPNAVALKE